MRFKFACSCGANWNGNVPETTVKLLQKHWAEGHGGEGHRAVTAREAGRVRVKQENRRAKEEGVRA